MLRTVLSSLAVLLAGLNAACADLVKTDLLLGRGDFEKSTYTCWWSTYAGTDYDFDANSVYRIPNQPAGYSQPTADDWVADGWRRNTGPTVNPGRHIVFRMVPGAGIDGSNCQYFALKNIASGDAYANLDAYLVVDAAKSHRLQPGDTITFRLDHIRMTGYGSIPIGTSVRFFMRINEVAARELTPSQTPFSASVTGVIPNGLSRVTLSIYIQVSGNLGAAQPGIYVDGAHCYVRRDGSAGDEMRHVPVLRDRIVNTQNVFFHEAWTDIYAAARDHDVLVTHENEYEYVPVLRAFNPNIKVYLYQSGAMCLDWTDSNGVESFFNQNFLGFFTAKRDYPDWLYTGGTGIDGYVNSPDYPDRYYLRITTPQYQDRWAQAAISKALKMGVAGIWIDDLTTLVEKTHRVNREAWEVQNFLHAVCPRLKAAGLQVAVNYCSQNLQNVPVWDGGNGLIWFNPFWTPTSSYPESAGYRANTPDKTPDVFFQEHSFFRPRPTENYYEESYWLRCLEDMRIVGDWNSALGPGGAPMLADSQKRRMHVWVKGRDFENDPAHGQNGWINFGLCSYLLAQNEWTNVGFWIMQAPLGPTAVPYPEVDLSVTKKLGVPDGDHAAYNGDPRVRYRRYKRGPEGSTGGVVVVNGRAGSAAVYRVEFDASDPAGNLIPAGTDITLRPRTGRILLRGEGKLDLQVNVPLQGVVSGQALTVVVAYSNTGSAVVENAVVRTTVPGELTYVAGSAEQSGGFFDPSANAVSWNVGAVAPQSGGFRTFTAVVK